MISAHQPGSQPIDVPEAIPNPAVPERKSSPSPAPKQPEKVPASVRQSRVLPPQARAKVDALPIEYSKCGGYLSPCLVRLRFGMITI